MEKNTKKHQMNEAVIPELLLGAALFLATWVLGKLNKDDNYGVDNVSGQPNPPLNVVNAIDDMWFDKAFIKDFAKIINDGGNFDKLSNELEKEIEKVKSKEYSYSESAIWKLINKTNFQPPSIAKQIVDKLEKTASYKKYVRKYKFQKDDQQMFAKLLLYVIMDKDFTHNAKVFILKNIQGDKRRKDGWKQPSKIDRFKLTDPGFA